jgi:hypothetical protein
MSEITIPLRLSLDSDGFLRRECPHCEREFKRLAPTPRDESEPTEPEVETKDYFCPLCHQPAAPGAWWTKSQLEYAQSVAYQEVVRPRLADLEETIKGIGGGGLISVDVKRTEPAAVPQPSEPADMIRLGFPCHPAEPVKVPDDWTGEVACMVCGVRYPIGLVRSEP